MPRREFLQLADKYAPSKSNVGGHFISEKLDGTRGFWDGGISRGARTETVPWASITDPKTGKRKTKIKPFATGLWSRYGNPIIAPDWFLNQLPCCSLDGELWAGRGNFQLCRSICGGDTPDPRFDQIKYAVYSSPSLAGVFQTGEIKNTNMVVNIDYDRIREWADRRLPSGWCELVEGAPFIEELRFLNGALDNGESPCYLHQQTRLPEEGAAEVVEAYLQKILDLGGEGVVIRDSRATWTPKRHKGLLKYKPFSDAEAVISGFTSGRETAKGSRLLGKIGALITQYEGKRLELAGLTDEEREFETPEMVVWAEKNPGVDMPSYFAGRRFKVGQIVTFKYRELSDEGIPKEARFWRRRDVE